MSSSINTTVNAYVGPSVSPNPIIFQYTNPEIVLSNLILEYLTKTGFSNLLPNFKNVRVSAEHPFINFLYNEEQGLDYDFNLLPSVTITDSNSDETLDTLSMGYEAVNVDAAYVSSLAGAVFNPSNNQGFLVTSTENMNRLEAATAGGAVLAGTKRFMTLHHTIELSIWADNKNVTSLLYEAINNFTMSYMDEMHTLGIDFIGISGKRSGDFNTDFGRLLWGATVVFNAFVRTATIEIDLETGILDGIIVNPNYSVG